MDKGFIDVDGIVVQPTSLTIERAKAVAALLQKDRLDYAKLVECRSRAEGKEEVLVVDVDVQRPQLRAHDIRALERIAVVFSADDARPDVQSLRSDFPQTPHLNLSLTEYPKSLCLYEQDWNELKARWTPSRFIERIRFWFAETARGSLHKDDQPLEPLIVSSGYQIVVPHDLFTAERSSDVQQLVVRFAGDDVKTKLLLATRPTGARQKGLPYVALVVRAEPQEHGVIRHSPSTLSELHDFLAPAGCDLLGKLRDAAKDWSEEPKILHAKGEDPDILKSRLIVIAVCPKRRATTTSAEASDIWTFMTFTSVADVLVDIGRRGKTGGYFMGEPGEDARGRNTKLDVLRTTFSYSRDTAAYLNGHESPTDLKIVAVGLGALGSKLQLCLARAGFGRWTLVDEDVLLPHNLSKHQYTAAWVGHRKSDIAAIATGALYPHEPRPDSIATNVLAPGDDAERLSKALEEADVILDLSASVTVARHLATLKSSARRISVFLNPTATDLVLLAEDKARTISADQLEFQLYRGLLTQPELAGHLEDTTSGRVRYSGSCRDITSRIPDDQVSLLAAIGAKAVRNAVLDEKAQIKAWRLNGDTFEVRAITVPTFKPERLKPAGDWSMVVDQALISKLQELREAKLPNETGGVLLGFFDQDKRRAYVVDTIPSPPDSLEWPTLYIRGSVSLAAEVKRVNKATAGNVEYIGEWHSHPRGCSCRPSSDDAKVFAWITENMADEGQPALMAIVGDSGPCFYLGSLSEGKL